MWEEIACGHTDGHRLTNYYIDFLEAHLFIFFDKIKVIKLDD